jgi:hypothetical protein
MKKVAPGANITDINTILFAEHGKEVLIEKGTQRVLPGGVNTVQELDQALDQLKTKLGTAKYNEAYKAAEIVKNLYATERQRLVDAGLISQELADTFAQAYPWYNPLRYLSYAEEQSYQGKNVKPFSVVTNGIRRLSAIGSEKDIIDPMAALSQELIRNEVRIQKNELAKSIINLALEDKSLGVKKRPITVPVAQVNGQPIYRPQHGDIPGTLSYFENGTRQVYDVPEWMYREVAVLNQAIKNPVSSFIGSLNGVSRAAFTTFSPAFVVANMFNDMLPALIRGGVNPAQTIRRLALSFKKLENDKLMQSYRLSGAYQGRYYGKDAAEIAKEAGASGGTVIGKNFNFKKAVLEAIPNMGEKGEQASRQAVFEKELNKTLKNWKTMSAESIAKTPEAKKAAADAVEATINFGRGGYLIRAANPFVIFLNASMEGTKLPFRTLRDSSRSRWTLAGLLLGLVGLTAYNMSYEEYSDVPDRVRWGSIVIMLPSNKKDINGKPIPRYLTIIPNTREWALFFGPTVYSMETVAKKNPGDLVQFAKELIPQLSPVSSIPIPQALEEVAEQTANYDFYYNGPIVSQSKSYLPATEQTGPYVSSTVEKTAQALGWSPLRLQHALQGLFGGAGTAVLSVLDMVTGTKNKRGLELKEEFDKVPEAKKDEWINKLSSSDKSSLISAINSSQTNIPIVSPVINRFYSERGGQLEDNEWSRFDKTVSETTKTFSNIPGIKDIGVTLGTVGSQIDLKPNVTGGSVDLTPGQRADYQQVVADIVIPGIEKYMKALNPKLSPTIKKEMVQKKMSDLKATAKTKYLQIYRGQKLTSNTTSISPVVPQSSGSGVLSPDYQPASQTTSEINWTSIDKPTLNALNNVWYLGKTLTTSEESLLKNLFNKYPLGQTNFNTWYKQTLRQAWDKYVASQ